MPDSHLVWSNRIDHLISAFGEDKLDRLHLDKEVDFSLNTPQNQLWLNVIINGAKWQFFYVPFIQKFDGKFDPFEIVSYESGLKREYFFITCLCKSIGSVMTYCTIDKHR